MNLVKSSKSFMLFFFGLVLAGCVLQSMPEILPPTGLIQITETVIPLSPNSYVETPVSTIELLPLTAIPIESLKPEKTYKIEDLYENNGDCRLPCWWGIKPGESLWQDTTKFLLSVGGNLGNQYGTKNIPRYDVYLGKIDGLIVEDIWPRIWLQNGVVKAISINSSWVSKDYGYGLSDLLKSFGVPEEIWLSLVTDTGSEQSYYYIVLMYPSNGILVELTGNIINQGDYLSICPQDIFSRSPYPPGLVLWNLKEQVEFKNFGENLLDDDLGWVTDEYRLLQEVSTDNFTNIEFYEKYIDANTKYCMNVLPVR